MRLAPLCLCLVWAGCASPLAKLAQGFGATVTGPGADVRPMLRSIGSLCRRQADLAYLRARLEDPLDRKMTPWRERLDALFSGRRISIAARCDELDAELVSYQLMFDVLLTYGAALRTLGESQSADFRDSFFVMGDSLGRLAVRLRPKHPELSRIMVSGADSLHQLMRLVLSGRSDRDLRRAVLTARAPVQALLERLERLVEVYHDQLTHYTEAQRALLDKVERATMRQPPGTLGRQFDVLVFYDLAQRTEEEVQRLQTASKMYLVTVTNIRGAHELLIKAATSQMPPGQALAALRQSTRELLLRLGEIADQAESLILRGNR